jgi:hypothetical protein
MGERDTAAADTATELEELELLFCTRGNAAADTATELEELEVEEPLGESFASSSVSSPASTDSTITTSVAAAAFSICAFSCASRVFSKSMILPSRTRFFDTECVEEQEEDDDDDVKDDEEQEEDDKDDVKDGDEQEEDDDDDSEQEDADVSRT